MKIRTGALVVALGLAVSGTALAQPGPVPGFYIGGGAGANWLVDGNAHTVDSGISGKFDFRVGYVGQVSAGYAFGFGLRLEGEASFRGNRLDNIDGDDAHGNARQIGLMANAAYDVATGTPFIPYVGVGAGMV